MNTIKAKIWYDLPIDYTGIVEWEDGDISYFINSKLHREDGPAWIRSDGYNRWYLDGKFIWESYDKIELTNEIVLSKTQHPNYSSVQVWKILGKDNVYEQTVIPGMEVIG